MARSSSTRARSRTATASARSTPAIPNQISLPRKPLVVTQFNAGTIAGNGNPVGDLVEAGTNRFFAVVGDLASGLSLVRWDETTKTFGAALGAPAAVPTNPGVTFQGTGATRKLFIPTGATGYTTWSTGAVFANVAAGAAQPGAVAFCVWDNKLVALIAWGNSGTRLMARSL
jgi:hypothetical protein